MPAAGRQRRARLRRRRRHRRRRRRRPRRCQESRRAAAARGRWGRAGPSQTSVRSRGHLQWRRGRWRLVGARASVGCGGVGAAPCGCRRGTAGGGGAGATGHTHPRGQGLQPSQSRPAGSALFCLWWEAVRRAARVCWEVKSRGGRDAGQNERWRWSVSVGGGSTGVDPPNNRRELSPAPVPPTTATRNVKAAAIVSQG
jgi:hypothetical protein